MIPSIGGIIHYVSYGTPGGEFGSECRAAIIVGIDPPGDLDSLQPVTLCVLNPSGVFFNANCQRSEQGHRGGTWHEPERV